MVCKNPYWKIILLVLLLALTMLVFMYLVFRPGMTISAINTGLLIVLEVYWLMRILHKANRDLLRFFEAFRFEEGNVSFPVSGANSHDPLRKHLNNILAEFQLLRNKAENERYFYLNILDHAHTGLMVTNEQGGIRFCNRAVQRMLHISHSDSLQKLHVFNPKLPELIVKMTPLSKELVKIVIQNEVVFLSLRCNIFRIQDEVFRIISFQDIKYEMEHNEAEAWQKLIRILTHEIMNSVSPITLTAAGIIQLLEKNNVDPEMASKVTRNEVIAGLEAIRKRSKGLALFVEGYQSINQLPQPVFSLFPVQNLFSQTEILLREDIQRNQAHLTISITPPTLLLRADEKLISQVIINLVQNALYALEHQVRKQLTIKAFQVNDQVRISVIDNGKGIEPALLDTVFVPFFTTREQGSGIGLNLSREIMKLHGGGIRVHSIPWEETTFTLLF